MLLTLLARVVFVTDEVVVIVFGVVVAVGVDVVVGGVNLSFDFCRLLGFVGEPILTDLVPSAGRVGLMSVSFAVGFGISGTVDTDLRFGPVALDRALGFAISSPEVRDGVLCLFGIFFATTPSSV